MLQNAVHQVFVRTEVWTEEHARVNVRASTGEPNAKVRVLCTIHVCVLHATLQSVETMLQTH